MLTWFYRATLVGMARDKDGLDLRESGFEPILEPCPKGEGDYCCILIYSLEALDLLLAGFYSVGSDG